MNRLNIWEHPKTGEKIKIPAKRVPAFTAGKMFKDRDVMKDVRDKMVSHVRNYSNNGAEE